MSQQINLLNSEFLHRKQHFSLATMLQGIGVILIGALCVYGYAFYQVEQLDKQAEEGERLYKLNQVKLAGLVTELSPQRNNQDLQEEVRKLEQQLVEQGELVAVLKSGALGNSQGYSEYMRAFSRQVVQGLWLTAFKVSGDGAQVSLSGGVVTPELLPEYIQRLRKERIMQGKTFAALQMKQAKAADKSPVAPRYVEFLLYSDTSSGGKE